MIFDLIPGFMLPRRSKLITDFPNDVYSHWFFTGSIRYDASNRISSIRLFVSLIRLSL